MSRRKRYVLYGIYLAGLVIVADLAAGALYRVVAPSIGRRNVNYLMGKLDERRALMERPHPYLLWENTPEYRSAKGIRQTNNLGYRNKEDFDFVKGEGVLRILALGGSTTWGWLLDSPEDAWPAQLQDLLNERLTARSHTRVEVINGGLNYGTTAELLLHYLFRDRNLKPDIVILHVGGNDAAPLLFDDYQPDYSTFRPGWVPGLHRLRRGERFLIRYSHVVKLFYACWLNDSLAIPYVNKQAKPYDLAETYYIENARRNEPIGFERNLRLLVRNILADGAQPILFPFVSASEEQFQRFGPETRTRAACVEQIRKGQAIAIEKDNAVLRQVGQDSHVPLICLSSELIPVECFLDHCHLSREGEAVKAGFVADSLCRMQPLEWSPRRTRGPTIP
jgi:lysophospholipase L1-like esterase